MSVCPYCRSEVETGSPDMMTCEGCGTPHHRECYEENKGCTLFGCRFAPPDDPKVAVTVGEASQAAVASAMPPPYRGTGFGDVNAPVSYSQPVFQAPPPPPPPPPGSELRLGGTASAPPAATGIAGSTADTHSTLFNANPRPPKSRLAYILLGIFLGSLGMHNFYAGYVKRGIAQLTLSVVTLFYGSFVTWIWAVVEVCTVDRDAHDISFI